MPGSHSEIAGNATRMARRTTSAHMNGITPRNTVPVETSGSSVLSTNMFIPTGGLISPISTTHTMMIPNQTGANPRGTTTGKNTGMVSSTNDSSSIALPTTTEIAQIAATTMIGERPRPETTALRSAGIGGM